MRLQECDLDTVGLLANPFIIKHPEPIWTTARDNKTIPDSLYRFYCVANYFSYGSTPRFLSDKSGILFPYLGNLARGIRDSFEETEELFSAMQKGHAKSYSPAKKVKKEAWDPTAAHQVRRSFRNLVVVLSGILDQFAEVTSIFFYGEMAAIKVGRASFTDLMNFAKNPFPPTAIISSPSPDNSRLVTQKSHRASHLCYRSGVQALLSARRRKPDGDSVYTASHV